VPFAAVKDRFSRWFIGEDVAKRSLADPSYELLELLLGAIPAAASGVAVSPESAMRCTAARCAVQAIAETVGQLPLITYQRTDETRERAREHPAYALLRHAFNPWTPASLGKEQINRSFHKGKSRDRIDGAVAAAMAVARAAAGEGGSWLDDPNITADDLVLW
jgi:phage portal protein BeeE